MKVRPLLPEPYNLFVVSCSLLIGWLDIEAEVRFQRTTDNELTKRMTMLSADFETGLAATVAPEDLRCGDFVAVLSVIHEYPSFFWCGDSEMLARNEPVRVHYTNANGATLLKVKRLCLPFVFVKEPAGTYRTMDIRHCRSFDCHANMLGKFGKPCGERSD